MATSKWRTEGEGDDAGQAVKRTPLRSVANTALHTVNIGGQVFSTPSPYLMEILEAARREIEAENLRLSQPVANDQSSNDLPDRQKRLPQSVDKTGLRATTTSEKLRVDVKSFLTEFRNCEIDRDGFVSLKYVRVAPTYVPRVGSILSTLAVELERYGFSFNGEASRIGFSKDGTTLGLGIDAPRKRETQISKSGWKQFSHVHVGRFKLHIYGPADGIKKGMVRYRYKIDRRPLRQNCRELSDKSRRFERTRRTCSPSSCAPSSHGVTAKNGRATHEA